MDSFFIFSNNKFTCCFSYDIIYIKLFMRYENLGVGNKRYKTEHKTKLDNSQV